MRITRDMVQESRDLWRANQAENLPLITALADYGFSGNTWEGSARTGSIGGRLSLPIFSGGETHGKIVEARAQLEESEDRFNDARLQIEEDVRLALQELSAAVEENKSADQAVALAQTELKMARDRYSVGVGDNIQVVSAQTVLAGVRDDQVNAVAHYDIARANLAAALGRIQELR
jgi:outer membrane protein